MTWQKIETAPKDGTQVLVSGMNGTDIVCQAYFADKAAYANWSGQGWVGWPFGQSVHLADPTHWMPLPDPPKEAK